jgi:hypothetical protein
VKEKSNCGLAILLLLVFAVTRWPGLLPENFSAAYALLFCAGVYFPGRFAWWLPLGTMLLSDILMNVLFYHTDPVGFYMLVNYLVYAAIVRLGRWFSPRTGWWWLLSGGLLGAILFYLVTNTLAWLQIPVYAKTLAGWFQALTTGVPGYPPTWQFFRNTLLSSGLFTGLFVGAMKLSAAAEPREQEDPAENAEPEKPQEAEA